MTVRELFYRFMREQGNTDAQIDEMVKVSALMFPTPMDAEIARGSEQAAEKILREAYAKGKADPRWAVQNISATAERAAKNN